MSLARDLLHQARVLSNLDPRRPKQANLRRAISACYYAFFHLFIEESSQLLAGNRVPGLAIRVSRSYSHAELKKACAAIVSTPLPPVFDRLIGRSIGRDLRIVAEIFIQLQNLRHSADYDTSATFSRAETLALIEFAETAFAAWHSIRNSDEASVFLTALAFGARWSK